MDACDFDGALPFGVVRGRGAGVNPSGRYEPVRLHVLGETLDEALDDCPDGVQVRTRVYRDNAKTVINPVDSPDLPFKWTLNPYRGCEHGCVYCYARPTHETFGMSCGLDFETRLFAKLDAPDLLRRELTRPKWQGEPIMLAGITDVYQPVERRLRITRGCLEIMAECRQPISIVTKGSLITRDLDLLSTLARHQAVQVFVSVTTLDADLARSMEPRASAPRARLDAMRDLSDAGVPVGVMVAPIVPGLNDAEIPGILLAARDAGARTAAFTVLRLPYQVKTVFLDWLRREFPLKADRVEGEIRRMRGGALNDSRFGTRFRGEGERAEQIRRLFKVFKSRLGLDRERMALSSASFRRPTLSGQRALFDE
ncbi:MAG: PA0069 family radical SAM protein [Phycisphaeraceae bacterium]|nr:PA0069 family radical SAM protein [Phycisphaeraceae bacterium]